MHEGYEKPETQTFLSREYSPDLAQRGAELLSIAQLYDISQPKAEDTIVFFLDNIDLHTSLAKAVQFDPAQRPRMITSENREFLVKYGRRFLSTTEHAKNKNDCFEVGIDVMSILMLNIGSPEYGKLQNSLYTRLKQKYSKS